MTKRLILEKALELFTDMGYEGATMDGLAKAVGIKKASLYAHFGSKESIFAAIFEDILAGYIRYMDELTAPAGEESALDRLGRVFRSFILSCHNNLQMYFWDRYFYYPPAFLKEHILQKTQETQEMFLEKIGQWLALGMAAGEIRSQPVRSLTLSYYYLMIGLSMSVRLYSREALESDTQAAWEGLRAGLAVSPRQA